VAQLDESGVPKRDKKDMWLTELEYEVRNKMRAGKCLSVDDIDEILSLMVNSAAARTKGFVLDINFSTIEEVETWGERLIDKEILTNRNELTHIVELIVDDDEVKRRSKGLMITPQNGKVYSAWERAERNKPKPVKLDEEGNPIEDEEEPEENEEELIAMGLKGPLVETNMVARSCDAHENF